jgi:uncharacterized membrane protein HdeD (DUF308 family)
MSETKAPGWLRAFDVVFGLIAVILSVVVLAYQELAILTMILVLSVVLLVTGIARIFNGVFARYLSDGIRAANVAIGIVAIALGIVALVYADLTTQLLIYILSFALLLNGVARLVIGEFGKAFPKWLRAFFAVVGVLTIILAALVFVYSDLGFLALVLLLSFTFMFNGIARIIQGVTGIQETEEF